VKKYSIHTLIVSAALVAVLSSLVGCDLIKRKKAEGSQEAVRKAVARVHDKYLYQDELIGLVDQSSTADDSTARITSYINSWIRKQLLISEAMKRININEAEVERKVLDYRYSLIGFEYQNFYIAQHLSAKDSITDKAIEAYYKAHVDNFILKQNIVQGTYIKVPKSAPRTNRVKEMLFSQKDKDLNELKSYCLSFSVAYHLSDSSWIEFDKLVVNSPIAEIPNKIQFLKTNPYYETSDGEFLYFLKVDAYQISDNISPLEFVKEDIRNVLLNKRKVELARALEDEVYENAVKQQNFEIFDH
jgi:hypothetical protein